MNAIEVTARILTAEGQPSAGLPVRVEALVVERGGWTEVVQAETNRDGVLKTRVEPMGTDHTYAPALRLVEPGEPAPRILAEGGMMRLEGTARRQALRVDFGDIERLEETAYARLTVTGATANDAPLVAGQPRRGEVTGAMMVRALSALNPQVIGSVAEPRAVLERAAEARLIVRTEADRAAPVDAERLESLSADVFNAEMLKALGREGALRAEVAAKDAEMAAARVRADSLEASLAEREEKLAAFDAERRTLTEENAAFRAQVEREAPIQSIALAMGTEADAANKAMAAEGTAYRLGTLRVSLHGVIGQEGSTMTLANAADLARPGAEAVLQGVGFDLVPERPPAAVPSDTVQTPHVVGLTESAARRALAAAGLRMESATRPGGAGGRIAAGQAMQQSPPAGAAVQPGETVLVVFAAP